jgi:hypothetical protein
LTAAEQAEFMIDAFSTKFKIQTDRSVPFTTVSALSNIRGSINLLDLVIEQLSPLFVVIDYSKIFSSSSSFAVNVQVSRPNVTTR